MKLESPSSKAMTRGVWEHHGPTGHLSMLQNAMSWRRKMVSWVQSCLLGRLLGAGCLEASCCWGNQCLYLFCLFSTVAKGTGSIRSSLCQTQGNFSIFFLLWATINKWYHRHCFVSFHLKPAGAREGFILFLSTRADWPSWAAPLLCLDNHLQAPTL